MDSLYQLYSNPEVKMSRFLLEHLRLGVSRKSYQASRSNAYHRSQLVGQSESRMEEGRKLEMRS
jgi:hypothetical protein